MQRRLVNPQTLDLIYEEVVRRFEAQESQLQALDQKAASVLGWSGVVFAVGAALFATDQRELLLPSPPVVLFVAALANYLAVLVYGYRAYRVRKWMRAPEPRYLRDAYKELHPQFTKRRLLSSMIESFEYNQGLLQVKASDANAALRALVVALLLVALAFVTRPWLAEVSIIESWRIVIGAEPLRIATDG